MAGLCESNSIHKACHMCVLCSNSDNKCWVIKGTYQPVSVTSCTGTPGTWTGGLPCCIRFLVYLSRQALSPSWAWLVINLRRTVCPDFVALTLLSVFHVAHEALRVVDRVPQFHEFPPSPHQHQHQP